MVKNLSENFEDAVSIRHFFRVAQPIASRWSRETYALPGGLGLRELLFSRKDMRENTSVHRLLRRALSLCLALALTVSLCIPALAANGDQENGGVVGVAHDAQIFAMQVFGSI